ncbi:TRAP transporter small permease subunit [Thalassomonas viridans]|uniref:TRAP transporter small permease protein n=1 Tax=Thalassomonas viridans TaxID=137584 RepID=A0AAE9Z0A3_9GAMM|nr:TRAP transporter small permease subunit [Thalassomonas viridans]WDE04451.1 TRAP transporter small permease subunit [Thalassomonas viridans]
MLVNGLKNTLAVIDSFTELTGRMIAWLTLVMVLMTFVIVLLRYGFNLGWVAMQESVLYFHGIVFMLGAAYTLKADGHVRVDIFYQRFSAKNKALVNLFGGIFLLLPVVVFIFYISLDYVVISWQIMEKSSEAGGLPLVYLNKSLLLLLPVTLLLQGLAEIIRNLLFLIAGNGSGNKAEQSTAGDLL